MHCRAGLLAALAMRIRVQYAVQLTDKRQHHRVSPGIAGVLYLNDRLSGEAARVPQYLQGPLTPADTAQRCHLQG